MAKYFSLLERLSSVSPWGVAFGDYSRDVVESEREDKLDHGVKGYCLKIISTDGTQAAIDARVAKLNGGEG